MHGNPTFRLVIVAVVYLLAGVAVWRVTQPAEAAVVPPAPAGSAEAVVRPVTVRLTFTAQPEVFELRYLGQTLVGGAAVMDQLEGVDTFDFEIAMPPEGIDLLLQATWPEGTGETAVRIRVSVAGRAAADETFWARGELADVVTVR